MQASLIGYLRTSYWCSWDGQSESLNAWLKIALGSSPTLELVITGSEVVESISVLVSSMHDSAQHLLPWQHRNAAAAAYMSNSAAKQCWMCMNMICWHTEHDALLCCCHGNLELQQWSCYCQTVMNVILNNTYYWNHLVENMIVCHWNKKLSFPHDSYSSLE